MTIPVILQQISLLITLVVAASAFSVSTKNIAANNPRMNENSPTRSSSSPYCINLECQVKEERRDEFLTLIRNNQKLTLQNEPEALQYVVGEDVDTRNVFYIHEQFKSAAGFDFHRDTPHNAAWQQFRATDPFKSGPIVSFYHGTHEPVVTPVVTDTTVFCLNVQLCIKPAVREEFLQVIGNNARGSQQDEPLCVQYHYGEDSNTPNVFHFHEEYKGVDGGKEGFEAHAMTPHFAKWEEFAAKDPFTQPPVISFFRTI